MTPLDHFRQSARVALDQNWRYWQSNEDGGLDDSDTLAALEVAFKRGCEQIIGEDEPIVIPNWHNGRNALRAAQRAALTKENQHGE